MTPASHEPTARFTDTQDMLAFGIKCGLGRATQELASQQLRERFPDHSARLEGLIFWMSVRMALSLLGLQLAQQVSKPALAGRIQDGQPGRASRQHH